MTKKALILLANGFEEIEAATPIDVLRRAGVEVTTAGVGGTLIEGAHGVSFQADKDLASVTADGFDLLVFPGGMPGAKNLGESAKAKSLAETMVASGKKVAAICAAPVMTLGAWGMLDGKKATCYPGMESMFPAGVVFLADTVVVDGAITTSRGPGTALPFSFSLTAQLVGQDKADEVATAMLLKK